MRVIYGRGVTGANTSAGAVYSNASKRSHCGCGCL